MTVLIESGTAETESAMKRAKATSPPASAKPNQRIKTRLSARMPRPVHFSSVKALTCLLKQAVVRLKFLVGAFFGDCQRCRWVLAAVNHRLKRTEKVIAHLG